MASKRPVVLGLIVTALATAAVLLFALGGDTPIAHPRADEQPAAAHATAAPVRDDASPATGDASPAADGTARVAVAAGSGVDDRLPGLVGRVVGPDGHAIAGAKVSVAPGVGFADANGGFDLGNLEDIADGGFEPGAMLRSVREQLADRVEVQTDIEGRFRVVAKGTSRAVGLRAQVRGHAILDRRFDRPREQDVDVGTLTLQAAAIVSGRVLTPGGAPIAGARVGRVLEMEQRLLGDVELDLPELGEIEALRGGEGAVTDELGQFELAHVTPGELTLRARHPEHVTARSQAMKVEGGREVRSVLLTMQIGGVIAGVVNGLPADAKGLQVMAARKPKADTGDATGMAGMMGNFGVDLDEMLGDVGLNFAERTAAIGQGGRFEVRGLARDTWRVWVARTGSGFAGGTACSARVEASPGDTVQLLFEPGVTVTFMVVDAKSSAPVERLTVRDRLLRSGGDSGIAALIGGRGIGDLQARRAANYPDGAVTVANLRPKADQKLALTIDAVGYASLERRDLELPKSGNLDLGVMRLDPVPVVQITVVAADHGRPVPGARVRFGGNGPGTDLRGMPREFRRLLPGGSSGLDTGRTDQDGRITLNRPQQAATIEVETRGFAPFASGPIHFSAEGPEAFTAQLHVGGVVAVTVCDPAEKPVAGAFVEHRSPGGALATRKADAQGIARFEFLAPGTHQFRLGKEGGGFGRMMRRGNRGNAAADGAATPAEGEQPWQPVEVADKATAALRLVAQPTSTLRGIVRENGVPLADALVTFREGPAAGGGDPMADALGGLAERFAGRAGGGGGASRSPRSDEQGLYQLRDLPAGEHHLRVTHGSRRDAGDGGGRAARRRQRVRRRPRDHDAARRGQGLAGQPGQRRQHPRAAAARRR